MTPTRKYRAATVSALALVPNSTLKAWRRSGVLVLERPDQEGWTEYSLDDALQACAVAAISRAGIPPTREHPQIRSLIYALHGGLYRFIVEGVPAAEARKGWYVIVEIGRPVDRFDAEEDPGLRLNVRQVDRRGLWDAILENPNEQLIPREGLLQFDVVDMSRRLRAELDAIEARR